MLVAIFVVPLVYFLNAFFIGRLIKKWKISINPFFATIIGLIVLFDLIYIISIWSYTGGANIWSYFVVFGVIQSILLVIYAANWRFVFITWSVNWKKVITFMATFVLIIIIGWLNFRNFNSDFGVNFKNVIVNSNLDIWKPMQFSTNPKSVISNFSSLNIMNLFWRVIFNINNVDNAITFCNWSWTIISAGFISCLSTWMISVDTTKSRLIFNIFIWLLFFILINAFIETFAIGDAWVIMLLFAYLLVIIKKNINQQLKLFTLTILLIGFLAVSSTSFFTVICVWIFSMYYITRNGENTLDSVLFLCWPLTLAIVSLLSIYGTVLLAIVDALYLVVAIIAIVIIAKFGSPSWDAKITRKIYLHSGKIVYTALIIGIATIMIANFFIFQEIYHWQGNNIDYKNFLTFTYTYIWNINIASAEGTAIFNSTMYLIFAATVIIYIIIRKTKSNKLCQFCKKDFPLKFGIISCFLFINPLVIHVLKISASSFPLNTLDLNMMFVVPIFIITLNANFNYKQNKLNNWKYNWY